MSLIETRDAMQMRRPGLRGLYVIRRAFFPVFIVLLSLAGCASVPDASPEQLAVAVWDLEDLSYEPSPYPDMGRILAGQIIETVRQKGEYRVVERQQLTAVLEELNLGSSSLTDESTRLRIGMLSGARLMIFGGYQVAGETMRMDLRLVEVETGKVLKAQEKTVIAGDIAGWMNSASAVAEDLIRK